MMRRYRPGRREQGGAVAVEAALITPVVVLIIFGILEFSFVMRDYVGVTSATRAAARAASTGAGAGACIPQPDDVVPCPAGAAPELAQRAADAISEASVALPREKIQYMLVYKANADGFPTGRTSMPDLAGCTADCVAYRWSPSQDRFRYVSGHWNSQQISACGGIDPVSKVRRAKLDSVGVQLVFEHQFMTGLFGRTLSISDRAVLSFEPLSNATCAAGAHP